MRDLAIDRAHRLSAEQGHALRELTNSQRSPAAPRAGAKQASGGDNASPRQTRPRPSERSSQSNRTPRQTRADSEGVNLSPYD